ncbi:CG9922-like protein [Fimicolochytrium jonesii]|uniref:CG9922-like protein n=1 Tax=Fimicolochytrium jonesii TaxID=1396493 RepID=UPI0022FF4009|nr:CG9922-like protein [Fimicolochytrium jonesii]KAI8821415.1 CG9922-like protein [Fimicolochytrium jonesii]
MSKKATPKQDPAEKPEGAEDVDEEQEQGGTRGQANKDMKNVSGFDDEGGDNVDEDKLGKAMNFLTDVNNKQKAQKTSREKELEKVVVAKEDIDVVMNEFQIPRLQAERALRENRGNLPDTLKALVSVA